jgi:ribonucleoside-diphosphate reductase subunit M1
MGLPSCFSFTLSLPVAIPRDIKELYKTVWEIKQKVIIDQAADRGAFICQSQSLNIHMAEPTNARLTSMHFYAWKRGLKTGMYYLRSRPKADAIQFTVDQTVLARTKEQAAALSEKDSKGPKGSSVNDENINKVNKATAGLDFTPEPACENCSA